MKRIYKILTVLVVLLSASCTSDFLDINVDPNNPTVASLSGLLTSSEVSMSDGLSLGSGGFGEITAVYTHQHSTREDFDRYGVTGSNYQISQAWSILYSVCLQDIETIINMGTESNDLIYVGIAQINKAFIYSQLVDLFGDVPFSEACNIDLTKFPKYDDDEFVYNEVFKLLDAGIANLATEITTEQNVFLPGSDDLIYGGDVNLWRKAAKSIKLKLYNQQRLFKNVSTEVKALISEGDLLAAGEDFEFKYGTSISPDNRHPGFRGGEYTGGQESFYISPWFYETMKGMQTDWHPVNPLAGINDPRVPYYFYRQTNVGTDEDDGDAPVEYRNDHFISIYFASSGPNRDGGQKTKGTKPGIYPIGGRYDEADGITVDQTSGPADVPSRFVTNNALLFIQAELALAGVTDGDDVQLFQDAMTAAFAKVDEVVSKSSTTQSVPVLAGSDAVTQFITVMMAKYNNATDAEKMEFIITQKWIASYGSAIDTYTDYRRTGYPILHNPDIDGIDYTTLSGRRYPLSLPWSQEDLEKNTNAPSQKVPADVSVFWDVN